MQACCTPLIVSVSPLIVSVHDAGLPCLTHQKCVCDAGLLFDWLYPAHFPVVRLCLEAWADTPEVTTALLRFMAEFVMNKNTRLAFDSSSPNGILLFREVSKVWSATWPAL